MKALGVGLGAVRLRRGGGGPGRSRRAPAGPPRGGRGPEPTGSASPAGTCRSPTPTGWPWPWWWPRGRPAAPTADGARSGGDATGSHRRRDERRRRPGRRDHRSTYWSAGPDRGGGGRPRPGGRGLRAPGGGDLRPGQQRCRRAGGRPPPRPAGCRVAVVEAGTVDASDPADLVIDAAYGTGFRGTYTPPVRPGHPGPGRRHPLGRRGRHRRGRPAPPWRADRTVTFVALKPGLLQGDGAALAGPVTVADIGLPGPSAISVMEDADIGSLLPTRGPPGATSGPPPCWWWPDHRGWSGPPRSAPAPPTGRGRAWSGWAYPGRAWRGAPATEAVSVDLPGTGWASEALEVAARCAAMVVGPGIGRDPSTAAEVRRLVPSTRAGGARRRRAPCSAGSRLPGGRGTGPGSGPRGRHRAHPARRGVPAADGRGPRPGPGRGGPPAGRRLWRRWRSSRGRPRPWPSREAASCSG